MTIGEFLLVGVVGFALGVLTDQVLVVRSELAPRLLHRFDVWRRGAS